jgi:hypothetical protein
MQQLKTRKNLQDYMKFSSSFTEKKLCLRFKARYVNALCEYNLSVISGVALTEKIPVQGLISFTCMEGPGS